MINIYVKHLKQKPRYRLSLKKKSIYRLKNGTFLMSEQFQNYTRSFD